MEDKEIKAEFRDLRERAGEVLLQGLQRHVKEIDRRAKAARVIYWTGTGKMPIDLFSYTREASHCFIYANFLGTIVLASSAVELILNRDTRVRKHIGAKGGEWISLSNRNLRDAGKWGLPVKVLLSPGETFDTGEPVRFVSRRNDVGHGNIAHWLKDLSDYDPSAEAEAFDQLGKSDLFLVEWFNSAPDVQECHIQNNRWP